MTTQDQEIALSVALGHHTMRQGVDGGKIVTILTDPNGNEGTYWPSSTVIYDPGFKHPMRFATSLDAMHVAENELLDKGDFTDPDHLRYRYSSLVYQMTVPLNRQPFRASAEVRLKALLTTLNLRKDAAPL